MLCVSKCNMFNVKKITVFSVCRQNLNGEKKNHFLEYQINETVKFADLH